MERVIAEVRVDALDEALRRWSNEADTCVEVRRERLRKYTNRKLVYGVDWAAVGMTTPEKAREFASNVSFAAQIAAKINELKLKIDYEADDPVSFENGEDYDAAVEKLVEWLAKKDLFNVMEYVGEGIIISVADEEVF